MFLARLLTSLQTEGWESHTIIYYSFMNILKNCLTPLRQDRLESEAALSSLGF